MAMDTTISLMNANIYQHENLVLNNVNLQIEQGEFVYLIGKTGSGKSSLLKTLYADLKLREGEGDVVGHNLKEIQTKDIPFLRRKLGVIFQDFQLLSDRTIEDNLRFVLQATEWKNKAEMDKKVLRYIGKLEHGQVKISLQMVDDTHPFYALSGSDNIISFSTERYSERPMVVKGPGAGAEVTAAGVFADIVNVGAKIISF